MTDQEPSRRSEDSAAAADGREKAPRERTDRYTEWLREQLGEADRTDTADPERLDPYGKRLKR